MQVAIDNGWYSPESGKPFIWQDVYAPTPREWATNRFGYSSTRLPPRLTRSRQARTNNPFDNLNQYIQYVEPLSVYSFSFKPERKVSVKDFMDFQRSTFTEQIYDKENDAAWY